MAESTAIPALRSNVPLAPLTTLGVGGRAAWYVDATSIEELQVAWHWAGERQMPILVLGGGSNLVIADEGWPGLVLRMAVVGIRQDEIAANTTVVCGAGTNWDDVVEYAVARHLAGIECLSGIPGTVGGTPIQNVGAYGQEVASVIERVSALDRSTGRIEQMTGEACRFGYRTSRFKASDAGRFIVCEVAFRLRNDGPTITYPDVVAYIREHAIIAPTLDDVRHAVLAIRRRKGMVLDPGDPDTRSAGSFFTNPVLPVAQLSRIQDLEGSDVPSFPAPGGQVKVPAGWLIEHAGFSRGFSDGPVGLSTRHPLAIVNRGGASARNVVDFAARIRRAVADRFDVQLTAEPVFAGFADDPHVAYLTRGA